MNGYQQVNMSRNAVAILIFLATFLAQTAVILFVALEWVPDFYGQTLRISDQQNAQMGAALMKIVQLFQTQIAQDGTWELKLSDAQINGWLATELPKQQPRVLPDTMQDPRIAIIPDICRIACQYQDMGTRAVLQMSVTAIPEPVPNQIRLRVLEATVGSVPGLEHMAEGPILHAAWKSGIRVKWMDLDRYPEVVASLPPQWLPSNRAVFVDSITFRQGEVLISGRAETLPTDATQPASGSAPDVAVRNGARRP